MLRLTPSSPIDLGALEDHAMARNATREKRVAANGAALWVWPRGDSRDGSCGDASQGIAATSNMATRMARRGTARLLIATWRCLTRPDSRCSMAPSAVAPISLLPSTLRRHARAGERRRPNRQRPTRILTRRLRCRIAGRVATPHLIIQARQAPHLKRHSRVAGEWGLGTSPPAHVSPSHPSMFACCCLRAMRRCPSTSLAHEQPPRLCQ
jgi:hypothetical protein